MNTAKEKARGAIDALPDDCSIDDILYNVYVVAKVERGLKDIEEGRTLSHDQVMKEMREWLATSIGQTKHAKT
jgi:predicted transcriptional regulator